MANPHGAEAAGKKCAKLAEEHRKKHMDSQQKKYGHLAPALYREWCFVEENLRQKDLLTLQSTCAYCKMEMGRFRKFVEVINEHGEQVKREEMGAIIMYPTQPFEPCYTCCSLMQVYGMLKERVPEIKIFPFPKPENGGNLKTPSGEPSSYPSQSNNLSSSDTPPLGAGTVLRPTEDCPMADSAMDLSTEPGGSSGPYHF